MSKKKAVIRYMTNGKPVTLAEIRKQTDDTSLREAVGDYITASEARGKANISASDLARWRDSGKIRAKKWGSRWFYSRQDLISIIKNS